MRLWRASVLIPFLYLLGFGQIGKTTKLAGLGSQFLQNQTSDSVRDASLAREVIDKYCITCHNERLRTSGLNLSEIDFADVGKNPEIWEKVLYKLRTAQMPPAGRPRPDKIAVNSMVSWLERSLDGIAATTPNPGRVGIHRLNRTEYANAIRDLLALDIDTKSLLLPDESDRGFDNVAASLTISPAHLERYLSAARKISRLVVGDPTFGTVPGVEVYPVPRMLAQEGRVSEDLPFGSRGGIAIRHDFPLDAEYTIKVTLRRQIYDYILGMGEPAQLDLRIDGNRVKRFTVGGEGKGTPGPLTWAGDTLGDIEWEKYMHDADAGLEVRIPVQAGTRTVGVSFVDNSWEVEGVSQPAEKNFGRISDQYYDGHAALESVAIGGPYQSRGPGDTPSRRAVFVCRPMSTADEKPCARKILSRLARRAYRRPVSDDDVEPLLAFYEKGRKQAGFDAGIQSAVERLLVSFDFLFRIESDPPKAAGNMVYRVSNLELASRLSFFLWSSIPDEELLDVAIRGRLTDPAVLEHQVRRMLADSRSQALVDNFGSEWLNVRKVHTWQPDQHRFPDFDDNLREAFVQETDLFLASQIQQDAPVTELLSANYTFVNERLAEHYGIPNIYGERFRRVTFDDGVRGGLLGQGSILMVTSYPDRTAPVLRGKWVLDNMLGMPPPPPPPNVPSLEETKVEGRVLSMRERMELHRKNPNCAVCHVRMDPLGFAFENFDAIGQWRADADGVPIDASAVLPDGTQFEGLSGLRKFLLNHREDFVYNFTAKLMTYAIGRSLEYYDNAAIRKILRDTSSSNYRWSSIIIGIVNSPPFQMRKTAS